MDYDFKNLTLSLKFISTVLLARNSNYLIISTFKYMIILLVDEIIILNIDVLK